MKIIFWNAYHGFSKSTGTMLPPAARKAAFAKWVTQQAPDTVIFLEATNFTNTSLGIYASHWNHHHTLLNAGTFPIALTSHQIIRHPICHHQHMCNGYMMATISQTTLFCTHLPPEKYADRAAESREVLSQLIFLLQQQKPFLFLADLNAKSSAPLPQALLSIGMKPLHQTSGVDFVMASPTFQGKQVKVQIPSSDALKQISDHLPIIIEWEDSEPS